MAASWTTSILSRMLELVSMSTNEIHRHARRFEELDVLLDAVLVDGEVTGQQSGDEFRGRVLDA